MSTVYFLGAGASKSILPSMPLASELTVDHLLDHSNYPDGDPPPAAIKQLSEDISTGRLPAGFGALRLEDALSAVYGQPGHGNEAHNLQIALFRRLGTLQAFVDHHPQGLETLLYEAQESGSTLVTTNYDALIECVLANMDSLITYGPGDPVDISCRGWIDYGVEGMKLAPDSERWQLKRLGNERQSLPLLKLHGSIGWARCVDCETYSLDSLFKFGAEAAMDGWKKCSACGRSNCEPVIVPPTYEKIYANPAISSIWRRAGEALTTADRIIFAGFSLHPSDSTLRNLLRASAARLTAREVLIIDPSAQDLLPRFREVFGDRVQQARFATFSELLESFSIDDYAELMKRRRRKLGFSPH